MLLDENIYKYKRIKEIAKWSVGGTPSTSIKDAYEGDDLWATIADLKDREIYETKNKIDSKYLSKKIVKKGDLLFSFKLSIGKVAFAGNNMYTNEAICSFSKNSKIDLNYLFYAAPVYIVRNKKINIYGADLLNQDLIKNATILYPPKNVQKKIAIYLDNITTNIDKKIKKYNKKIELLKEYKEALIYETITKGLDKKSNILWKAKRLKDIIYLNKGKAVETVLEQINGYLPLIDTNYLRNRKDNIVYSKNGLYVKKNEVLVLWDGANSGEMFYNTNNGFLGSTFGVMKLKSKVNNSKFLFYYLKAFEKDIRKDIVGMGIPHVNGTKLKQRLIYIPPNNEQNEIVNFLDKKTKEIDSEVKKLYKKIELIKELKESIIYECVTGKLDIEKEGEKYQKIIESI